MPKPSTIEKFRDHLFDDADTLVLTDQERDQLMRYRAIFTLKLEKPHITNREVAEFLKNSFGITSIAQAYRDISTTEMMLGKIRSSEKQWIRYLVVEKLKDALALAEEKGKLKEMIMAADKLAKYTRLDQEEQDPIPWEEIIPAPVEYLNDPKILGLPEPREGARAFVEKIKRKYIDLPETEYEEVKVRDGKLTSLPEPSPTGAIPRGPPYRYSCLGAPDGENTRGECSLDSPKHAAHARFRRWNRMRHLPAGADADPARHPGRAGGHGL